MNPNKHFKKTPETFSEESKIIGLEKKDPYGDVILDSVEEVIAALRFYNKGSKAPAVLNAMGKGIDGNLVMSLVGEYDDSYDDSFMKHLIKEVVNGLETRGRYDESFDYTFNNFDHNSVEIKKDRDKYLLSLVPVAYDLSIANKKIAKAFNKPRALYSSAVTCEVSVVDDYWFNFNIVDFLNGLPVEVDDYNRFFESYLSGGYKGSSRVDISFKNQDLLLSVFLNINPNLRPEGGEWPEDMYAQRRGDYIVGGAWRENYSEPENPEIKNPILGLSVSMPEDKGKCALTEEDMNLLCEARDWLVEYIN